MMVEERKVCWVWCALIYIYPYMHAGSVITDPSGSVTPSGGRGKKGVLGMV